jgi:7-keto-8-aminopelargonate synthetase-like enzyme
MTNVIYLRQSLTNAGLVPLGVAGPMVLVPAGAAMSAHQATVALQDAGAFAQLLEAPILSAGSSLWQFQVMADHTATDIDSLMAALRGLHTHLPATYPRGDPP